MKGSTHAGIRELDAASAVQEIVTVLRCHGYLGRSEAEFGPQPEPPDLGGEIIAVLRGYGYLGRSNAELGPQPEPPDVVSELIAVLRRYGYRGMPEPARQGEGAR